MKFKISRNKIIATIIIVVALLASFWYGGNAPGLRGWGTSPSALSSLEEEDEVKELEQEEVEEAEADLGKDEIEDSDAEVDELVAGERDEDDESDTQDQLEEVEEENPSADSESSKAEPSKPKAEVSKSKKEEAKPEPEKMVINKETGKDQYLTDPVPQGKPIPVEPENSKITDVAKTASLVVRCDTILDNIDWLDPEKVELVPENGVIFPTTTVTFYEGESVFNLLQREMKKAKIHMEFMNTPIYNSAYIEGINNLYEFDCGELSGWMYKVNGWFPNYGASRYQLKEGDVIEWHYTCDLGIDVGGNNEWRK